MAIPHSTTGSLGPTFVSARRVCLTVKLAYIHILDTSLPTRLSQPSYSSVTLWEDTAPVKLAGCQCPSARWWQEVSYSNSEGWCFIGDSARPKSRTSQSPTYAKHQNRNNSNSV